MAGLAHAGDDDAAARAADQFDRGDERRAERRRAAPPTARRGRRLRPRARAPPRRSRRPWSGSGLERLRFAIYIRWLAARAGRGIRDSTDCEPARSAGQRLVNHNRFYSVNQNLPAGAPAAARRAAFRGLRRLAGGDIGACGALAPGGLLLARPRLRRVSARSPRSLPAPAQTQRLTQSDAMQSYDPLCAGNPPISAGKKSRCRIQRFEAAPAGKERDDDVCADCDRRLAPATAVSIPAMPASVSACQPKTNSRRATKLMRREIAPGEPAPQPIVAISTARPQHRRNPPTQCAGTARPAAGRARHAAAAAQEKEEARRADPYAPLGIRSGGLLVLSGGRIDRRLRHQSGAHAERRGRHALSRWRRNCWSTPTGRAMSSRPTCAAATPAIVRRHAVARPAVFQRQSRRPHRRDARHAHRSRRPHAGVDRQSRQPELAGRPRQASDLHDASAAPPASAQQLQPPRCRVKGTRRPHRLSGLDAHRRRDREQRRPQLQPDMAARCAAATS